MTKIDKYYSWLKKEKLLPIIGIVLVFRVLLTGVGVYVQSNVGSFDNNWVLSRPTTSETKPSDLYQVWSRWDSGWYKSIAENGYRTHGRPFTDNANKDIAFFPAYPYLSHLLSPGLPDEIGGLAISTISTVSIISLLYVFLKDRGFSGGISRLTIWLLFAYPMAFILGAFYTEAMFLALALGALYFWQKDKLWLTFWLGALAGLTRPVGLLLLIPGAIAMLQAKFWQKPAKHWLPQGMALSGPLLSFAIYTYISKLYTGGWLAFREVEKFGWDRSGNGLGSILNNLFIVPFRGPNWLIFGACAWISIVLVTWKRKELGRDLRIWTYASISLPLSTILIGMPRYIVTLFPVFLAGALIVSRKPRLVKPLVASLFVLQIGAYVLWVMNAQFMQ
jgi:hypothetical protein